MLFKINNETQLDEIINEMGDGIAITDKNLVFIGANARMAGMYGLKVENLLGKTAYDVHPEFEKSIFYEAIIGVINTGIENYKVGYSNNTKKWMVIRGKKVKDFYVMILHELTESKAPDVFMKKNDSLTGLPNRFQYEEDIREESKAKNIVLLDIKNFKIINETVGMKIGDFYLMKVAARLKSVLSKEEKLYRYAGDQFLIFNSDEDVDFEKKVIELMNVFIAPVVVLNKKFQLDITIGCLKIKEDEELQALRNVEIALNYAKKTEKDYTIYSPDIERKEDPLEMKKEILDGLEKNEFELYFQPQGDFIDNKVVGAEVLIRWNHPTKGFIPPNHFLPIAKELGIMKKIDKWVLCKSIQKIKELEEININLPISINMTSESLNDDEVQSYIIEKLESTKTSGICFEITETGLMNFEKSKSFIDKLKDLGNFVAIDDFGTGYCSLEYLLNYSFDFLKIDRKFIEKVHKSDKNQKILSNIIKLGHSLNIAMIAEGVEEKEEYDILKRNECDIIQGYYYIKPIKFQDFIEFSINKGMSDMKSKII